MLEEIIEEKDENQENQENQEGQVVKEDDKPKRKKVNIFRFTAEQLTNPQKGMIFFYEELGKANIDQTTNFNEIKELGNFMKLVEEWHYYIVPKYDFQYFVARCQKLGTQASIKSQLQKMRKAHRGIIPWDFVKNELNDIGLAQQQENIDVPQQPSFQAQVQTQTQTNNTLPDQQLLQHIIQRANNPISFGQTASSQQASLPPKKVIIFKSRVSQTSASKSQVNQENSSRKIEEKSNFEGQNVDDIFSQIEDMTKNNTILQ